MASSGVPTPAPLISTVVTTKFEVLETAGVGTRGVVYRARRLDSRALVAVKDVEEDHREESVQASLLREISLLLEMQHPNVVKLQEVLNDKTLHRRYLVFDYLDMDLQRFISKAPQLMPGNSHLTKFYMWQLLQGMAYCHSRRVIHRNIKPQNLLIDFPTNSIKLAGFGHARTMGLPVRCLSPEVATIWYRPPELLLGSPHYTVAVDMWSLGCVFYEMATSTPMFAGTNEIDQMHRIFKIVGYPNEASWPGVSELPGFRGIATTSDQNLQSLPPEAWGASSLDNDGLDLLRSLLQLCPQRRISAKDALNHSYFRNIQEILNNPPRLLLSR